MNELDKIPVLGKKIQAQLPGTWSTSAFHETKPQVRRVVCVFGPKRPRNLFGRPTLAMVYVFEDKVEIKRVTCTDAQLEIIRQVVVTSTKLPVTTYYRR